MSQFGDIYLFMYMYLLFLSWHHNVKHVIVWWLQYVTDELRYIHLLITPPLKYPLSFDSDGKKDPLSHYSKKHSRNDNSVSQNSDLVTENNNRVWQKDEKFSQNDEKLLL